MTNKIGKRLQKLNNKQIAEDIKKYIRYSHDFYSARVPEMRTLAKRLHEEHNLKDFYKVFNRLWKSSYHGEVSLAIYTLQLYKEEFNLETWNFLKPRLNEIKSWDQVDSIGINIIGEIVLKNPKLEKEIIKFAKSTNIWLKRMAIVSTLPLIRNGDLKLAMQLIETHLYDKEEHIQKAIGWILNEMSRKKPDFIKKFILRHIHDMHPIAFYYATEKMKDLRKMRKIKKLKTDRKGFFFWKN